MRIRYLHLVDEETKAKRSYSLAGDHKTFTWKMGFEPLSVVERMPVGGLPPPREAELLLYFLKTILLLSAASCREESFFFYFVGFPCFLSNVDFIAFS